MKNTTEMQLIPTEQVLIEHRRERYLDNLMTPFLTDPTKVNFLKSFGERVQERFGTGLVIGRFQPFHGGHAFLIEQALEVSNEIVICIGSANKKDEANPFSLKEREIRIRKSMHALGFSGRISKIVAVDDYNDHELWLDATLEETGSVDAVFGNNPVVKEIFEGAGYPVISTPLLFRDELEGKEIRRRLRSQGLLT